MRSGKAAASSLPAIAVGPRVGGQAQPAAVLRGGAADARQRAAVGGRVARRRSPRCAARCRPGASGERSGSRSSSSAARSAASAASAGVSAASIMAASRGCAPSRAMRRPGRVMPPVAVERAELAQQRRGGGQRARRRRVLERQVGRRRCPRRRSPAPATTARPPGFPAGRRRPGRDAAPADHSRIATPGPSRPARPARCSAAAREMRSVASRVRPVPESSRGARRQPPSTTMRTPGTVSEVSAIEVASTHARASRPGAARGPARRAAARRAAAAPGRRSLAAPPGRGGSPPCRAGRRGCRRHARPARRGRRGPARPAGRAGRRCRGRRGWTVDREHAAGAFHHLGVASARPGARRRRWRTSPAGAAPGAARACRSRQSASARSDSSERSWISSRITAATPSRPGSDCRRRTSRPSVTTSIRVAAETAAVQPGAEADGAADRFAAAARPCARRRRGWRGGAAPAPGSCPSSRQGASSRASGTSVVLPAPGGATSTALRPAASCSASAGSASVTGRSGSAVMPCS